MLKVVGDVSAQDEADGRSLLDEIAREGARRMLVAALETEVAAYVEAHGEERDDEGHALVVRNGKGRTRKITLGAGTIPVSAPRVNDRRRINRRSADGLRVVSAAVHAPLPEGRRGAAGALPARSLHRRLPRGPGRIARGRCAGIVRHEHRPAHQRVGDRVPRLPEAQPRRSRLRYVWVDGVTSTSGWTTTASARS
jgi:hypothetical protein